MRDRAEVSNALRSQLPNLRVYFLSHLASGNNGCIEWTGHIKPEGYGQVSVKIRQRSYCFGAHRVSWELHRGHIPEGMTINHRCRNRRCVNPDHLEVMSMRQNTLDSPNTLPAKNAAKTHCKHGHSFSGYNLAFTSKGRRCRTCARLLGQKQRAARSGLTATPKVEE